VEIIRSMKDLFYGHHDKRKWLQMLRVTFIKVDPVGKGTVDRKTLAKVLRGAKLDVGEAELEQLVAFLKSPHEGQFAYSKLLRVWDNTLACPKEEAHEIMKRMLAYVGKTSSMRLRWVRRLKKQCTELDKYRRGLLELAEVAALLRDTDGASVLKPGEDKLLADAFMTEDLEGVAYRQMLRTFSQVGRGNLLRGGSGDSCADVKRLSNSMPGAGMRRSHRWPRTC
jgi:hypothetical protein